MEVLVLGSGYAGLTVAHRLREYVNDVKITVISRNRTVYENTIFPALLTNDVNVEDTKFDAQEAMELKGNSFIEAEVQRIDPQSNEVKTSKGTFDYDYLILALGGAYEENFSKIPGNQFAFMHHPLSDFLKIKERLGQADEIDAVIGNFANSPIEGPSYQLALIVKNEIIRRKIKGRVTLITQSPRGVFGMLPLENISKQANSFFEKQGIELVKGDSIAEVRKDKVVTKNGKEIEANFVSILPRLSAPEVVAKVFSDDTYYVPVELPSFRTKSFRNVFAVGDLAQGMVPARTARGAMIAAENAVSTIIKELKGIERPYYKQGILCMFHGGGVAGLLRFDVFDKPRANFIINPLFSKIKIIYSRMLVNSAFNVPFHAAPPL
jgi:sulfide:quinone oxidoreductase